MKYFMVMGVMAMVLSVGGGPALAAPAINMDVDRGAYLAVVDAQGHKKLKAAITVDASPGFDPALYDVAMTTPRGDKHFLQLWGKVSADKSSWSYWLDSAVDIAADARDGGGGAYIFTLVDASGKTVSEEEDFLIPHDAAAVGAVPYFDIKTVKPADGALIADDRIVFSWGAVESAAYYILRIYQGEELDVHKRVFKKTTVTPSLEVPVKEMPRGKYHVVLEAGFETPPDETDNVAVYQVDGRYPWFELK